MKKKLVMLFLMIVMALVMAAPAYADDTYVVRGTQNYLAVRTEPRTSSNNEIGRLFNGETFTVTGWTSNNFAYGYSTTKNVRGYVNGNYLVRYSGYSNYNNNNYNYSAPQYEGTPRIVSGVNNYLGLRTTPTRNDRDEIGRLYNGQTFRVLEFRNDGFAYGIAPNGQRGYVVSGYLR